MNENYDVVIVGGGAAGLGAGVTLSRSRRLVLVIDSGTPRNAPAGGVHNYLGRENISPAELLEVGRAELTSYGGAVMAGEVVSAKPAGGHEIAFRVELADGRHVNARRLLVATGLTDELPDVEGLASRWGRDVLHCPYCHGWEVRDQAIGVLASGPFSIHQALMFRQLSDDVVVFLNDAITPGAAELEQLAAMGISVVAGPVAAIEIESDQLSGIRLASGRVVARQALVVGPVMSARDGVLASLGLPAEPLEMGGFVMGTSVPADAMGATAVPGVWVAGNVGDMRAQVISSAAAGVNAGAMINADLIAEDVQRAVSASRVTAQAGR